MTTPNYVTESSSSLKKEECLLLHMVYQRKINLYLVMIHEPIVQNYPLYHGYHNVPIGIIRYDTPYETPEGKNIGIIKCKKFPCIACDL